MKQVPPGAVLLNSWELLTRKDDGTFKNRMVLDGSGEDIGESADDIAKVYSSVVDVNNLKVMLCTGLSLGCELKLIDVRNAFVQSDEDIESEDIYVKPPRTHPDFGKFYWILFFEFPF